MVVHLCSEVNFYFFDIIKTQSKVLVVVSQVPKKILTLASFYYHVEKYLTTTQFHKKLLQKSIDSTALKCTVWWMNGTLRTLK